MAGREPGPSRRRSSDRVEARLLDVPRGVERHLDDNPVVVGDHTLAVTGQIAEGGAHEGADRSGEHPAGEAIILSSAPTTPRGRRRARFVMGWDASPSGYASISWLG